MSVYVFSENVCMSFTLFCERNSDKMLSALFITIIIKLFW